MSGDDEQDLPGATVILGCGFAGSRLASLRLMLSDHAVYATTRDPARARVLGGEGVRVVSAPALDARVLAGLPLADAHVLIAFPPDDATDDAVANALASAKPRAVVYLSTTGVYGDARGHIDEETPTDESTPRAAARLACEQRYREACGATAFRTAGIYGPGRGLHQRIARGDYRIPGDGTNVVSRIHVEDLAMLCDEALAQGTHGSTYAVADDAPVPQIEAIRWLCARLGRPMPPFVPIEQAPETLRHDRSVDNARIKRDLSVTLRFPTYREGFEHCVTADRLAPG